MVPPGSAAHTANSSPQRQYAIWLAFSAVVVLGIGVVVLLPGMVKNSDKATTSTPAVEAVSPIPAPSEPAQAAPAARQLAEQAAHAFLAIRARLELANVIAWGDPEWPDAVATAEKAHRLYGQLQFQAAERDYNKAIEMLKNLEAGRESRLQSALVSAQQALTGNDSTTAVRLFELALAIDAGNETALAGKERALARPEVLLNMREGQSAEQSGKLVEAQSAYRAAIELDLDFEQAGIALERINTQLDELAFKHAMSSAIAALEANQVQVADRALRKAAELKPADEAVDNIRFQLEQKRQSLWLAEQRMQATDRVNSEQWAEAVSIFRKVLATVPQAAFATEGLKLAQDRARLHLQLDHYLDKPSRIYSDEPLANAEILVESVGRPPADESKLNDKLQRLRELIAQAHTPQVVTLVSDGLTHVVIYHVGRLGQFTSRQLELRPGTYTVVGSRAGFRDVRRTIFVEPGADQAPLDIRCEEPV